VITRALIVAALAAALLPATASAATTRPVQAFDTPTFRTIWTPKNVPAQVGDTVEWRFAQPGNPNTSTHDVWLVAPGGGTPQNLGASYTSPTVSAPVSQVGTYQFYCSIHGGLAPGGMNGKVEVTTTNPGPAVDPGTPWTDPDWEDPDYPDDGPQALPNQTTAPTVFEEGDNDPPLLELLKVTPTARAVRVRVDVSEAGTLTMRLKRGKRVVATKRVEIEAGETTASIALPSRAGRYRLQVWATDAVELDSRISSSWVRVRP
jgi:plastocyanin